MATGRNHGALFRRTRVRCRPNRVSVERKFVVGMCLASALISNSLGSELVTPGKLPDPQIPGFHFPETESTINAWVSEMAAGKAEAFQSVHLHAWGLWTALTQETSQWASGQNLKVFESWLTVEDIASLQDNRGQATFLPQMNRERSRLQPLGGLTEKINGAGVISAEANSGGDRILGFIKFNGDAAAHVLNNRLLSAPSLQARLDLGSTEIPAFPSTAISAKPIFQIVRAEDLIAGRYYRLKVWPGPPEIPQAWGPAQWPGCVWIDILSGETPGGKIDNLASIDGSSRQLETTYPLTGIINYRLSAADAAALNEAKPGTDAAEGDYALLVAMHVTTRETTRWTWQTYWWSPTPDDPHLPSSPAIAHAKPVQLQGAARNYAMAVAYSMQTPEQPVIDGANVGPAVYAYNPWIEAGLSPSVLPDSIPGLDPSGRPASNNFGVQTNCMSCHARANFNPRGLTTAPRSSGARYTDLIDPRFIGTLQVDFLWAIPRNAK